MMSAEPAAGAPQSVELAQVRECHFKAKPCALCGEQKANKIHQGSPPECDFKKQLGCVHCGRAKSHRAHYGSPPSLNLLSSGPGANSPHFYAGLKKAWQAIFYQLLDESGLPRGLDRVYVEGEITFDTNRSGRDQGNYRVLIEKALGDALEAGGWIPDDSWDHYEFGGLSRRYVAGQSATRLIVRPNMAAPTSAEFTHTGEQMGFS